MTIAHMKLKHTSGGCRGVFSWPIWALTPTKYYENKTVCVFFQGAFDGTVKISKNIARKSKNTEILNLKKIDFSKIDEKWI